MGISTLGAWGVGWEVWLDGMEVTQFTYFQQCGGVDCSPIPIEITYGLERIAMFLQDKESIWDLNWNKNLKYSDIWLQFEKVNVLTILLNLVLIILGNYLKFTKPRQII